MIENNCITIFMDSFVSNTGSGLVKITVYSALSVGFFCSGLVRAKYRLSLLAALVFSTKMLWGLELPQNALYRIRLSLMVTEIWKIVILQQIAAKCSVSHFGSASSICEDACMQHSEQGTLADDCGWPAWGCLSPVLDEQLSSLQQCCKAY